MKNHSIFALLAIALTIGVIAGCSPNPAGMSYGTVNVHMTDAPGDFESVNLVITQVSAHLGGDSFDDESDTTETDTTQTDNSGWIVLNGTPATYDLLTLQNGVFVTIGTAQVPAGHYTQVRLKLGAGSTVTVDGVVHPLTVPSGMQTGLKLIGPFDVPAGGTVDIALDFDAARSIHQSGAGSYTLKPTVKVVPFTPSPPPNPTGTIQGLVSPAGTETTIYALQAPDTLGSTAALADGRFTFQALAAGVYSLAFHPASGFRDTTLAAVNVTASDTTDVGTVVLTPQ